MEEFWSYVQMVLVAILLVLFLVFSFKILFKIISKLTNIISDDQASFLSKCCALMCLWGILRPKG